MAVISDIQINPEYFFVVHNVDLANMFFEGRFELIKAGLLYLQKMSHLIISRHRSIFGKCRVFDQFTLSVHLCTVWTVNSLLFTNYLYPEKVQRPQLWYK